MGSEWRLTTLGNLIDEGQALIQTGPFGSQLHASDYTEIGVSVIPTKAIGKGRILNILLPKIGYEKASELKRHLLRRGDILFARRGIQATGLSALIDENHEGALCGTGAILLRLLSKDIDPIFLSLYLSADSTFTWLRANAVGAVMPNLNATILRGLPLCLPKIEEQTSIAETLMSLGDKIELNRKMNATLEEMAQALFKSWFVDFDPVKAKAQGRTPEGMDAETAALFPSEFEESELGLIPKGWRVAVLDEAFDINPSRKLAKSEAATYLDMGNVPTSGHRPTAWIKRAPGSGVRFTNGDTLLARITPCLENGKTAFVDFLCAGEVGWGSTEFIVLRPKQGLPDYFAYLLCRREDFRAFAIQSMTGTSGRQRVQTNSLAKYKLALPESGSLIGMNFGEVVAPLAKRIKAASEESATLASLRDALLPKLISGQLRIPDAERLAGAAL